MWIPTIVFIKNRVGMLCVIGLFCLQGSLVGCGGSETNIQETEPVSGSWRWQLPAHFPIPVVPDDNPMTVEKVELGRHLFYDKRLSGNQTQSCASCHKQSKAFTDGFARAKGSTGMLHPRSSMSLVNVAYSPTLNWATPSVVSLEQQIITPLFGTEPVEQGLTDAMMPEILRRFSDDKQYQRLFTKAYPNDMDSERVSLKNIIHAITSFERSLISADSKYDRYLAGKTTLTPAETRGMNLFFGEKAECFHCHGSFNFNDQVVHSKTRIRETPFHNTGLYNLDSQGSYPEHNNGVFETTQNPADKGKFRAPSLRNVAVTAPYNHDGSTPTLEAVLENYANGGRNITPEMAQAKPKLAHLVGDGRFNPNKDDLIVSIDLTKPEQDDLIAFLKILTDETLLTNPRFSDPFAQQAKCDAGSNCPANE